MHKKYHSKAGIVIVTSLSVVLRGVFVDSLIPTATMDLV